MKKIFITGGAGYVGTRLVPILLDQNYKITVYDNFYFGNFLRSHENLHIIKGDIRDTKLLEKSINNHDYFINLACISNDASFELDEKLSTTINLHAFEPMVKIAKKRGIKRFIYASSSSVYGLSEKKNVTEEHPLVPLTLYNKYKGLCEPILNNYKDINFEVVTFRPATVCGYSPRMRLDLTVNILTNFAINKNEIKVFGGNQLRPNLHILDYCNAVITLLEADKELVNGEIFNVGYQNLSVMEIAQKVKKVVEDKFSKNEIKIKIEESDDNRSYHINSDKIKKTLNFTPKHTIEEAIYELCEAFIQNKLPNSFENTNYFNVKKIKELKIK